MVVGHYRRLEDLSFDDQSEASGSQDVSQNKPNYISASYPFKLLNRNMIISLSHQHLFDFNRDWDLTFDLSGPGISGKQNIEYDNEGSLSAIGMAYCVQINPRFSFGATLNFWENGIERNGWEITTTRTGSGTYFGDNFTFETKNHILYEFSGINANLGFLWNPTNNISIGAVLKTPFTADIEKESEQDSTNEIDGSIVTDSSKTNTDEELDMPMSYGLGIAYRYSDTFTISFDIYRTEWDEYILTDSKGNEISPITGKSPEDSNIEAQPTGLPS